MWPTLLDLHTLHIEHAAFLGAFTVLTSLNSLLHRSKRGSNWFPVFTFAAFLGAVLTSLQGRISDILALALGTLLSPVAYLFLHLSLAEFFHLRARGWRLHLVFIAAATATLFGWGFPNVWVRFALFASVLALQLSFTAAVLLRNIVRNPGPVRRTGSVMAGIVVLLALNTAAGSLSLVLQAGSVDSRRAIQQISWSMLISSVLQSAAVISYVWMTAARLQEELTLQATTDPLTRLLNRRAIASWAELAIRQSQDQGWPLSAILIDLDEFKGINDAWGHHCGDCVLLEVARVLSTSLRPGDQIARLGGDEFVILLPRTPEEEARNLAERLRAEITGIACTTEGGVVRVRASFGVSELGSFGLTWEDLVQRCDKALYVVKGMGGNRTLVH